MVILESVVFIINKVQVDGLFCFSLLVDAILQGSEQVNGRKHADKVSRFVKHRSGADMIVQK